MVKMANRTVQNVNFALLSLGDVLLADSAIASLAAYCSHDGSGLQYVMLTWGIWCAAISACFLAVFALRVRACLACLNLALPFVALLVATLPQVTGLGYDGSMIDLPGTILASVTLALTVLVAVPQVKRLRRQSTGSA
jgi:hypothetical protein